MVLILLCTAYAGPELHNDGSRPDADVGPVHTSKFGWRVDHWALKRGPIELTYLD